MHESNGQQWQKMLPTEAIYFIVGPLMKICHSEALVMTGDGKLTNLS
jgi:hypothetical protein